MNRTLKTLTLAVVALCLAVPGMSGAAALQVASAGPFDATVLIVRHAEKPASGDGLTRAGEARAEGYVAFSDRLQVDSQPVHIDELVAAADTPNSARPRLTLEPLSKALNLAIEQPVVSSDVPGIVYWLDRHAAHRTVLIAWHHSDIPDLIAALGESPAKLLPFGRWPANTFDEMIVLRYDGQGNLLPDRTRVVREDIPV